jgi:AcrR family transcriptional regulator
MTRSRLEPNDRRDALLACAVALAESDGYGKVNRSTVADRAGVSPGIVSHYFGTVRELREAVMEHAIAHSVLAIVADGIAVNDSNVAILGVSLRRRAKEFLSKRAIETTIARTWKPSIGGTAV